MSWEHTAAGLRRLTIVDRHHSVSSAEKIPTLAEVVQTVPEGKRLFIDVKCGSRIVPELNRVLRGIETCGKPVAVAINGLALGGGLEVCLACHYRVLAEDTGAVLGFPEVNIGLLPGAGGTQRLPRLIGAEKALKFILTGDPIPAPEAKALGIVDEVAAGGVGVVMGDGREVVGGPVIEPPGKLPVAGLEKGPVEVASVGHQFPSKTGFSLATKAS